jgi:hypothetical protein
VDLRSHAEVKAERLKDGERCARRVDILEFMRDHRNNVIAMIEFARNAARPRRLDWPWTPQFDIDNYASQIAAIFDLATRVDRGA